MDEKCLIIKEALSLTDQSNKLFLISFLAPKIKRLEVARKRRAGFKPTYINHHSFYSFIFQIILRCSGVCTTFEHFDGLLHNILGVGDEELVAKLENGAAVWDDVVVVALDEHDQRM